MAGLCTTVQYPPYFQSFNILHISLGQWNFAGRDEAIGPNLPYTGLHCFSLSGQIFYIEYEDDWPPPGCSRFLFLPRHKPNPLYYPWWQLQGTRHTCCHQHQLIIAQSSDTCAPKLKKMSRYCLPSWSHGTSTNGDLTKAQDPPGLKLAMSRISLDLSLISEVLWAVLYLEGNDAFFLSLISKLKAIVFLQRSFVTIKMKLNKHVSSDRSKSRKRHFSAPSHIRWGPLSFKLKRY